MANIKSRDIEDILRRNGVEKGTVMIITHLIERINDLEAAQTVCGQMMDRMSDLLVSITDVIGQQKQKESDQ